MLTLAQYEDRDDRPTEDHMVRLHGVTWDDNQRLLAMRGEGSAPRIAYLEGEVELSSYAAGWLARDSARAQEEAAWRARIEARLPQVVRLLAEDFGATRVLLFGSLARGTARPESDVDLLVDGLPLERLIEATARVDRLLAEANANLVPADRVRPEVLTRALAEGILLHGD